MLATRRTLMRAGALAVAALLAATIGVVASVAPAAAVVTVPGPGTLSGGGAHTCVLTGAGGARCWGYNATGGLGDGTTALRLAPVDVVGFTSGLTAIDAGGQSTCTVTDAGAARCWGWNGDGQLGDGTRINRLTPVEVDGLAAGVAAISVGYYHACALTTAGGVKCWGANDHGQLGDGTTDGRLTPVDVTGLTSGVVAIATGIDDAKRDHTCALTAAGGVKCWGANGQGQLGDGTTTLRTTPVDVVGLTSGVAAIYAGGMHSCAVTTGGAAQCWGDNDGGQLGDGTTTTRLTPVDVVGLGSGVASMSLSQSSSYYGPGRSHTCAVTTAGAALCWGRNSGGEVGDGTSGNNRLTPTPVTGLDAGVVGVSTAFWTGCAVSSAGAVRCWGANGTGDGTNLARLTPVYVSGSFFGPDCPVLAAAPYTSFTLSDGYAVGTTATFTADPGFELVGPATVTCQAGPVWDGPPPTARSTGVVAVVPATGLSGGDVVEVQLSDFPPNLAVGWAQCVPLEPPGVDNCSVPDPLPAAQSGTTDGAGALQAPFRLDRFIHVPRQSRWVDCADPAETCVIGAAGTADVAGTAGTPSDPLVFATPPPPPATRGTITIAPAALGPAGGSVLVSGSGFRAGAAIDVFQCVPAPPDPSGCNRAAATATADATGSFTVDLTVVATVLPPGGSTTGCFGADGACVVAAAEAVDFPGTVTTTPIDLLPTVVPGNGLRLEGSTATKVISVPVTLSKSVATEVTVDWATVAAPPAWFGPAAQPGVDYVAAAGTVTFAPGETMASVPVTIVGDTDPEANEAVVVRFTAASNATVGGFFGFGLGTIVNDDVRPLVVPGGAVRVEGDSGSKELRVPVTLSVPPTATVTVDWTTLAVPPAWFGPAGQDGVDYEAASGTVTFGPGETVQWVPITIFGDAEVEPDEVVVVRFSNAVNATLDGFFSLGVGHILDDD